MEFVDVIFEERHVSNVELERRVRKDDEPIHLVEDKEAERMRISDLPGWGRDPWKPLRAFLPEKPCDVEGRETDEEEASEPEPSDPLRQD